LAGLCNVAAPRKANGRPLAGPPMADRDGLDQFIAPATLLITFDTL
jgi:hypothetical protein